MCDGSVKGRLQGGIKLLNCEHSESVIFDQLMKKGLAKWPGLFFYSPFLKKSGG